MKDWAIETIRKLKINKRENDMQAIIFFCEAYKNGDSVLAYEYFSAKADKEVNYDNGKYFALLFPDGSVYADFIDDYSDRFFWSISDFLEYDADAAKKLENAKSNSAISLGRKGGSSKSQAKQKSSRENGKLGGRPRNSSKQ